MRPLAPFPVQGFGGLQIGRPLLSFARDDLRLFLKDQGQAWIDDPMNDDPRFARVKIRQAWPQLEALVLDKSRIADTAAHLSRARTALEYEASELSRRVCHIMAAGTAIDAAGFSVAMPEIGLRVLASVLMAVSGQPYRPRFERLMRLYLAICQRNLGAGRTLHGCIVAPAPRRFSHFGAATVLVRQETCSRKIPKQDILK